MDTFSRVGGDPDLNPAVIEDLQRENEALRRRLDEAEAVVAAIREGDVDEVVVQAGREEVYTLATTDTPYRLVVDRVPQAAATLTTNGIVLSLNSRFAELVKRPQSAVAGHSIRDFVTEDSRPTVDRLFGGSWADDLRTEITFERPDDSTVTAYFDISALREGPRGPCVVMTDLTEQRRYRDLQIAQAALREADRRKNEFVATLAHELRNPLAPIRNALEILKTTARPEPSVRYCLDVIDRQVRIMARQMEDLFDASRLSRHVLQIRTAPVNLIDVIRSALEASRPLIEAYGHQLTVSLAAERIMVDGDETRLTQIFVNLLNNAAKFTEYGGRIQLTVERDDESVVIKVADNGIGLTAEMLPSIFDTFSQATPALSRSQGGLGVGLALARGLVELHGGTIGARSDGPGKGTEFTVRLSTIPETTPVEPPVAKDQTMPRPFVKHRIVIADDNQDGADSLGLLLKVLGHDVAIAHDGEQAVRVAERMNPDVVLLDIGMPKLNGYDACRRIQALPSCADTVLIAVTGWGREDDRRRVQEAGFDAHLVKPIDPTELSALLASLTSDRETPNE